MPTFDKQQKEKLVQAVKAYNSSVKRRAQADADVNDKTGHLKNALGSSSSGPQLLDEAMKNLGEFYLEDTRED